VVTQGYRYHMSNVNAAIGLQQLRRLEAFKARKQDIVRRYDKAFREVKELVLIKHNLDETFPFFYVVRVLNKRRDSLMKYLREKDIRTGVHYVPNHLQPLFSDFRVPLPATEKLYEEIVTLPLYFEMTDNDVETVIEEVCSFFSSNR
jgi:perosamine synthetase